MHLCQFRNSWFSQVDTKYQYAVTRLGNEFPLLEAALSNLGTSLIYMLAGLPLESLPSNSSYCIHMPLFSTLKGNE